MYATFACTTYRDECEAFAHHGIEPDESSRTTECCSTGWADLLPAWGFDLEPCPHCHGPSFLVSLLEVVA